MTRILFPSPSCASVHNLLYQTVKFATEQRPRRRLLQRIIAIAGLSVMSSAMCLAASVSPTSLSWASVAVGNKGAQKVVTLTNNGTATLTISSITLSGTNPQDFLINSKTCGSSLAVSASCTANIIFAPTVSGTRTATLNFNDNASPSPQTVALSGLGTGGTTGGSASVSPTSLSWVSVAVGSKGAAKAVTLTNSGTTSISISSITFSGANPGDYLISSKTCGTSLAASASCTASIAFAPTTSGTRTATLNFNDSATNTPQTVSLSGTGTGTSGTVTISPTSLSFGSINVGSTTASQTATLKNGSASSITISGVSVTGTNAGDFVISSKTCGSSLAAGASCSISVAFKPTANGSRAGTLTVSDSSSNSPQTVALSGTGGTTSGSVTVSPTSLGFASTAVGSTSAAQSATLTNGTSSSITISSVTVGGTNAGDFAISSKTCGTSLAASASCSASVVFKPTASGTRTATLSFADSGSGSPQNVALSGSGPAAFQIEPTNPTVIVNDALQFSATTDVTWSASCGSISSTSGIYTAPSSTGSCTVTATQMDPPHATASTVVKVVSSPSTGTLGIYPTKAAVYAGTQQIFQAQLSMVPDGHSLTFSVDGVVGGSGGVGTITNQGVYTAPNTAGNHTVTVKDNTLGKSVNGTVTVFSNVTVDFGSRSTALHQVPAHFFGAERMNSMHNTADLDLVKAAGFNYARLYAQIPQVFLTNSTPNWNAIDPTIQWLSAGGTKIMLQVYQTPTWLQPSPNPCGSSNGANAPPKDMNAWGQLAVQIVKHMDQKFPGVVTDYEIWNEPNTTAFCSSARLDDYMNLYKASAPLMRQQIKTDNSTARVGGPATAGMQSAWVNAMLADTTIAANIDFLAYHDYMFSSSQLGAQWNTYNGVTSVYQKTQDTGDGPMKVYNYATRLVAAGKQPQGKNLPIYNTEYNLNWAFLKNCCESDYTLSPVWNSMYISDVLNSVYNGAPNTPQHMVYFAATAAPYFCLVGEIDANMDCAYPKGSVPSPYPQYFLYQLFGSPNYLGLQNGGNMAQSIAPPTLGNGLIVTAFFTSGQDAIVLTNPTGQTLTDVPVNISNTGFSSASATLYEIVNGQSIQSSSLSLHSTGGTSYSTTVTLDPYTVHAISIH